MKDCRIVTVLLFLGYFFLKSFERETEDFPIFIISEEVIDEEMADSIFIFFWDDKDFRNLDQVSNRDEFVRKFTDFAELLNNCNDSLTGARAVENLIEKSSVNPEAFKIIKETASQFFYEPVSPFMNEESYIHFLNYYSNSEFLNESTKKRYRFLLNIALKNRPNYKASDFEFITKDDRKQNLWNFPLKDKSRLLLIFYDPDCDSCKEIIDNLAKNEKLNHQIKNDEIQVLAIYPGDDIKLWKENLSSLPNEWTVGMDTGNIEEQDLYYFFNFPTVYLLDNDKRVIIKEMNVRDFDF